MTAVVITTTSAVPVVSGDEDTWGTKNNAKWGTALVDLQALAATPANTIKGNNTGGAQGVDDLTPAEVTAMLPAVAGDAGSGGTKGLAPATVAGDKRKVLTGAGAYQAGYGRAFGCVISSTSVNGSTPTIAAAMNVASISNVTEGGGVAYADLTFTDALPSAAYAVHVGRINPTGAVEGYDNPATGSVRIYWGTQNPATISVSGFA
jgi:hypothetical protein